MLLVLLDDSSFCDFFCKLDFCFCSCSLQELCGGEARGEVYRGPKDWICKVVQGKWSSLTGVLHPLPGSGPTERCGITGYCKQSNCKHAQTACINIWKDVEFNLVCFQEGSWVSRSTLGSFTTCPWVRVRKLWLRSLWKKQPRRVTGWYCRSDWRRVYSEYLDRCFITS